MVASVHPVATEAGLAVLKSGGNAVDAAVAMALTLGVVNGENSGLGGGCFMLIRRANGSFVALDGRETAPGAATRDMFVRNGKGDTDLSQTGPLASGVPGALAAYEYAVRHYGKKKLRDLLLPAAAIAENGFVVDAGYANVLKSVAGDMSRFESSSAVFFRNGRPLAQGDILKQPELAATYRHIAEQGSSWFYEGPFAQEVEQWMKQNAGLLRAKDFRAYQVRLREPVISSYRKYSVIGFPPPSSGGVHVAQILNMLERFDVRSLDEATRLHVIAECMKIAFADRAYWLGDPDFAPVPRGLVDKSYAASLAAKINKDHVAEVRSHGEPPDAARNVFKKHTISRSPIPMAPGSRARPR
jgi:gamma-glutamyltranspeptidase/glutathione hydrolase